MSNLFGGPTLQDLRDLWDAQPMFTYETKPQPIAQGWQCGGCGVHYAPHVSKCECQRIDRTGTGDNATVKLPRYGTFTTEYP